MKLKCSCIIITILVSFSCAREKYEEVEIIHLNAVHSFNNFNDSIFFAEIVSMENIGNAYFLVDVLNHTVINIDSAFHFIQTIGQQGRGPGEFLHPFNLFEIGNQLYISDAANRRINVYSRNEGPAIEFSHQVDVSYLVQDNKTLLLLNDSCYYCSTPGEEGPVRITNLITGNSNYTGQFYDVKPKTERNIRYLVKDKNDIYAIGVSEPVIEKYTQGGELSNRVDLSPTPFFEQILEEQNKVYLTHPSNTTPYLFKDVFVLNGVIYLLVNEKLPSGFSKTNKILTVKPMAGLYVLSNIFDLGKGTFNSFCFSPDMKKLLAFNEYLGEVQVFNFPEK